jgi:hypothetical protein
MRQTRRSGILPLFNMNGFLPVGAQENPINGDLRPSSQAEESGAPARSEV